MSVSGFDDSALAAGIPALRLQTRGSPAANPRGDVNGALADLGETCIADMDTIRMTLRVVSRASPTADRRPVAGRERHGVTPRRQRRAGRRRLVPPESSCRLRIFFHDHARRSRNEVLTLCRRTRLREYALQNDGERPVSYQRPSVEQLADLHRRSASHVNFRARLPGWMRQSPAAPRTTSLARSRM